MKHFVEFTQPDAYGSEVPGGPLSIQADSIRSYAAFKSANAQGEVRGTMIFFTGSHGEMNTSFVAEPHDKVAILIREALEKDKISKYAVEMDVITTVIDIMAAGVEKWGPILQARLNDRA